MIDFILGVVQVLVALLILGAAALFLVQLMLAWAWAQSSNDSLRLSEVLSTAAIEWASVIFAMICMVTTVRPFLECPPLHGHADSLKQLPVVLIPSLHSGSGLFRLLTWRLKGHFFLSIWPFYWKSFLITEELLEDNLESYLDQMLTRTGAPNFRIISFGTSRPIIAELLHRRQDLKEKCDRWIAISAPKALTPALKFLKTKRLVSAYDRAQSSIDPDVSIYGTHDTLCFPSNVFQGNRMHAITPMNHYSVLFHSTTLQIIFQELT